MSKESIPENVIWVPENGGFYSGNDPYKGDYNGLTFMGQDFLSKWQHRCDEFIQDKSPRVLQ